MTSETGNYVQIMVPLKYLSNFWRTLVMPLINCRLIFFKLGLQNVVTGTAGNQEPIFPITDTNPYVPVMTISAQDNAKLLQQLKTGFKRIIKIQSELILQARNPIFKLLNWSKFSGGEWTFCFIIWKWFTSKKLQAIFSSV